MHTIGVISDTHGLLRPQVLQAFQGVQHIIHAGDAGSSAVIDELRSIAPVTAVRGNVDAGVWAIEFPETAVAEFDGKYLYVIHNLEHLDFDPCAADFSAVIYGHSHVPAQEIRNGILYFNPGSAGPRRFHLPASAGLLTISGNQISCEIITLAIG
jgi:uncharacterized protein